MPQMVTNHLFKVYTVASMLIPLHIIWNAMNENKTIFSTLVNLTSFKLNLLIFFNAIIVLLV